MLDDLNELKTFRAILVEGSLSAAARRLGVTLAVVSKRLSTLEGRAGVRLVHRSTRSLSPTEEGARMLMDVVRALEAIEAAEGGLAGVRDEPTGTLRVSAPIAFGRRCVVPVLGQLTACYPRLAVALELDDRVVDLVRAPGCCDPDRCARRQLCHNAQARRQPAHPGRVARLS
jgi:DNA-binding transcriptional LysR family regulator